MEMDLIERIPVFGRDYTNDNFAQEAALKDYISFNKGCYIGQEPNARLFFRGRPQKQLVSLSISASSHDGTYLGMAMVKTKVLDTEDTNLSIIPDDPEPTIEWSKLPTHIMR